MRLCSQLGTLHWPSIFMMHSMTSAECHPAAVVQGSIMTYGSGDLFVFTL